MFLIATEKVFFVRVAAGYNRSAVKNSDFVLLATVN
jgi:hypothetical protein